MMFKLDNNFLISLGLGPLPIDEKNKLLAHIYETLELNVGMKLAEQMSDAQLNEFEAFIGRNDEAGALQWLEGNFPGYKQVVADELEKLKGEITAAAPQILAAAGVAPDAPITGAVNPPADQSAQPQPLQPAPQMPSPQPMMPPQPAMPQPLQPAAPGYQASQSMPQPAMPAPGYQASQPGYAQPQPLQPAPQMPSPQPMMPPQPTPMPQPMATQPLEEPAQPQSAPMPESASWQPMQSTPQPDMQAVPETPWARPSSTASSSPFPPQIATDQGSTANAPQSTPQPLSYNEAAPAPAPAPAQLQPAPQDSVTPQYGAPAEASAAPAQQSYEPIAPVQTPVMNQGQMATPTQPQQPTAPPTLIGIDPGNPFAPAQ